MENKDIIKRPRGIIMAALTIISIICISVLSYLSILKMELNACDQKLSKKYGVNPTTNEIYTAIYSQMENTLQLGMSYDEVIRNLNTIAPVLISWREYQSDGAYYEYIILKTCYFKENGVSFLISFSSENQLKKIQMYVDD